MSLTLDLPGNFYTHIFIPTPVKMTDHISCRRCNLLNFCCYCNIRFGTIYVLNELLELLDNSIQNRAQHIEYSFVQRQKQSFWLVRQI